MRAQSPRRSGRPASRSSAATLNAKSPPAARAYLYRQLADLLREEIRNGHYRPGMRLPSMDDLSRHHNLNRITVIKALRELAREGLVHAVPAQGTYVSDRLPAPVARRNGILTVGLVSHVLHPAGTGPYHTQIIGGIHEELGKAGGVLTVLPAAHLSPQSRIFEVLQHVPLDAVIYLGPFEPAVLRRLISEGPPSVLVDFQLRGVNEDTVLVDNRSAGFQAMEHLLSLGHRDCAVILGPEDQVAVRERLAGVREALAQVGLTLPASRIVAGAFTRQSGEAAMRQLLQRKPWPTAVFCLNDEMAIGAMQALRACAPDGRAVPVSISLVGCDDIPSATAITPALTTIRVETAFLGRTAVQRLVAKLRDPLHTATTTIVPTHLVVRASTAQPAGGRGLQSRPT